MKPLWDRTDVNDLCVYREFHLNVSLWDRIKLLFKGKVWVEIVEVAHPEGFTAVVWPTVCRVTVHGEGFETQPEQPNGHQIWHPYSKTEIEAINGNLHAVNDTGIVFYRAKGRPIPRKPLDIPAPPVVPIPPVAPPVPPTGVS